MICPQGPDLRRSIGVVPVLAPRFSWCLIDLTGVWGPTYILKGYTMTNLEIDFFEYKFYEICNSVVWTTDFEEEYDPDEQWENIKEKMFQAVNEVLTLPDGLGTNDCVTSDEVDQLLTTIFIKEMNEWLPLVS